MRVETRSEPKKLKAGELQPGRLYRDSEGDGCAVVGKSRPMLVYFRTPISPCGAVIDLGELRSSHLTFTELTESVVLTNE